MTHVTADRLHVTAAWLNTLPLPEPSSVTAYADLSPGVDWRNLDPDTALQIIATIGGEWAVYTYADDPKTIADRYVDHLGTSINVTVTVYGVNLPDLAADAGKLAGAVV